jgi:hypothetical protein
MSRGDQELRDQLESGHGGREGGLGHRCRNLSDDPRRTPLVPGGLEEIAASYEQFRLVVER